MSPPDAEYWELEAAKAWGYGLGAWYAEDPLHRARVVAHERERELRDAHLEDWKVTQQKQGASGAEMNPLQAQRARFGLE